MEHVNIFPALGKMMIFFILLIIFVIGAGIVLLLAAIGFIKGLIEAFLE